MAAKVVLNWTAPGGSNSISQDVQYRLYNPVTPAAWTLWKNVGPTVATIDSDVDPPAVAFADNKIYQFRVVNNCTYGGPIPGPVIEAIKMTCPTVVISGQTFNSFNFSFSHVGGDVNGYDVVLLKGGVEVARQTKAPAPDPVTGSFTGLDTATAYTVRVEPKATGSQAYSKTNCATVNATTTAAPTCSSPSSATATIS